MHTTVLRSIYLPSGCPYAGMGESPTGTLNGISWYMILMDEWLPWSFPKEKIYML